MSGGFAGAVQAAVFGTGRTRPQDLFPQSRACAMHANSRVGSGDATIPGKIRRVLLLQIDRADRFRVLRLQPVHDAFKATAYLVLDVRSWLGNPFQLARPRLQSPLFRALPPGAVNRSIAQQPVEPGHSRFAALEVVAVLKRAKICGLENILGQPRIRNAALHKRKELPALGEKLIESCFRHKGCRAGGISLPPGLDGKDLAAIRARAKDTFASIAAGAVLAFHFSSPLSADFGRLHW